MGNGQWRPSKVGRRGVILGSAAVTLGASLGPASATKPSGADREFLAWDMQIEVQQQDMGRIAAQRALTREVRDLGEYLIERHQQAQRRLQEVAHRLGVTLSDTLSATHRRVQRHYAAVPRASFDKAFVRHEVGDYRYFLTHFEAAAQSGDAAVRAYATGEIPRLKEDQSRIAGLM